MNATTLRGRQIELARLISEARAVVDAHDAMPSGPGAKETWDREFQRGLALDYLRRICIVDAGQPDPGR